MRDPTATDPPDPLRVEITVADDACRVRVEGELDLATVDVLDEAMRRAEDSPASRIVLDLSGLSFMDSTGLRLILSLWTRSRADSSRLRLVRGPDNVHAVFEVTKTAERLPWTDA
jgi:anti-sigma B factor antagonist